MIIVLQKDAEWCADTVYNGMVDLIIEAEAENEKREKRYQATLPLPELNVKDMITRTKSLARETFEKALSQGQKPKGGAAAWEIAAVERLKRNLLFYIKDGNELALSRQIWATWPDTAPPPDLTPEQIEKLLELQDKADELMKNLAQTIKDTLGELLRIAGEEAEITKDTAATDRRFLSNQISWFKSELYYQVVNDGACPSPLKKSRRSKPRGWTKED